MFRETSNDIASFLEQPVYNILKMLSVPIQIALF